MPISWQEYKQQNPQIQKTTTSWEDYKKNKPTSLTSPTVAPQSPLERISQLPGVGFGTGFGKSILGAAQGLSDIGSWIGSKVTGKDIAPFQALPEKATTPQTTEESIGYWAGNIAQVVSPTEAVGGGEAIGKALTKTGEIMTSGRELKATEKAIAELPMEKFTIKQAIKDVRASSSKNISDMTQEFKTANTELQRSLAQESQLQSAANKSSLKELFKSVSDTYGKGLDKAESELAKQGKTITKQDYLGVINKTIEEAKNMGVPEDSQMLKTLSDVAGKVGSGKDTLSLTDIKNLKSDVVGKMGSSYLGGTKYAEINDFIGNIFMKNHGDFLGNMSPELKQLNKEFAPMARARSWAMKNFRPYTEEEIQRGANVLSRLAKNEVPDATTVNYLKTLEEGSGSFKGVGEGTLTGKIPAKGKELRDLKTSFQNAKFNLINSTDYKISQLEQQMAGLQKKGIELGQAQQKLANLKKIRNVIIGTTFVIAAGETLLPKASGILKSVIP